MARAQRVRPLAGPMINSAAKQIHTPSFRGDAKHRTRNLEIPRCAIAHLRSGPSDHPGMTALASNLAEQLVDIFPVHQMLDKRLEIIRTAVAIIDVVGMLPDVAAEDRRAAMHQRAFAVGGLGDFELAVLHREPAPAGAELADAGGGEIGLEFLEATEILGDLLFQTAGQLAAAAM